MAIPFFSLDLKKIDFFTIIRDILFPWNKSKKVTKVISTLEKRYPNRKICLLPSGRLGLYLSLKYLFKKGDEIIFSSMSFPLYVKIAKQLELKVRLVDVSNKDLNIDVNKIEEQINRNTKGIVVTHLFGNPCDIYKIKNICERKNLKLIEDCAQSFNSKINDIETGNFGDVGIVSTSLLKIPTTLSGGILILKDQELYSKIINWVEMNISDNFVLKFKLLIKILLSILNSYPAIYSILSDKIFIFLKSYNPRIYRKILYSGMGMKNDLYDPKERPALSKFQLTIGLSQLNRCEEMNKIRKEYSQLLQKNLEKNENIIVVNDHFKDDYNHQYFVIFIKKNFSEIYEKLFKSGIHVMDENVWDCTKYGFEIENNHENFTVTKNFDGKLLRIQNNSLLKKNQIEKICKKIIDASN